MAKLVTKFKYLKPGSNAAGRYVKYIATREGVEMINDSKKYLPATVNQKQFIEKMLLDFPDAAESLEYADYIAKPNRINASELISRTMENNIDTIADSKTYADYIATRPRTQKFGSHGLFTDDGVAINLSKVSEELKNHNGNVWTMIVSLHREDAERLGFNRGERWRDMLRTQVEQLSTNLKIPMKNLRWYAAFHNESHHPHIHLIAYSVVENEGYLTRQGIERMRSSLANDIFHQDLISVYEKQTEHRREIKESSKDIMDKIISEINSGVYDNPQIEEKLLLLADKLSRTSGKIYSSEEGHIDMRKAIDYFKISANTQNSFAEYQLGKIYLYGNGVEKDYDTAIHYLNLSAEHGNQYAEQLLYSIQKQKNIMAAMSSLRLLQHVSNLIRRKNQEQNRRKIGQTDRKMQQKINEKKQAHGLKPSM